MGTIALDIDGTLRPYGGLLDADDISLMARYAELAIVSARADCKDVARRFGIPVACCAGIDAPDKAECLRRIGAGRSGGRAYIADLPSDFDAARAAGWSWSDVNSLCLNIGAGATDFEGCINVDVRPLSTVHLVMNILDPWPFPDGSISKILAYDIIEHIPWRRQEELWGQISRKLKRGGAIVVRAPDMDLMYEKLIRPRDRRGFKYLYQSLSFWIGGGQDYPEDTHLTFFTKDALLELARTFGLDGNCGDDGGTNLLCELRKL